MTTPEQRAALLAEWRELQQSNPPAAATVYLRYSREIVAAQAEEPAPAPVAPAADPEREKRAALLVAIDGEANPVLRARKTLTHLADFTRAREESREFPDPPPRAA